MNGVDREPLTRRGLLKRAVAMWVLALAFSGTLGTAHGFSAEQPATGPYRTPFTLATMPRIDVHTHIGKEWQTLDEVLELRRTIQEQRHVELAMWFSLGRLCKGRP